uniref:Uncharacterized protein n=1 Tax=Anguilla anguilla TaxID=7936 RepID=A0A0E9QF98_ANGAN
MGIMSLAIWNKIADVISLLFGARLWSLIL